MQSFSRIVLFTCITCVIASCVTSKKAQVANATANIKSLKFLAEYDIPFGLNYNNTVVGGLSGIDYDREHDRYYLICDDRSAINPARFYSARINIQNNKIDTIAFTGVKSLLQPNGAVYPNSKQDPFNTPDAESIRYIPLKDQLLWSSEGERNLRENEAILSDPAIRVINPEGKYIDSFPIPINVHMRSTESGPRQNSVFEGMAFANNFKTLFVSVEEPLYEDGPRADVTDNNAYIRILKFDVDSKKNISQYAYKLEPIKYPADPVTGYKINGVSEILSLDSQKLLVIERAFSTGRLACVVKIFITELQEATDIINIPSLKIAGNFKAAHKKLLLDMSNLGIYIDNIEGITFGPVLPNGHRTLLFIADNNFNPLEKTQVLLFEVNE
ncbi:MAG: esterase-like activity of phytase family protein [Ferruginibacter sp.]